MKRVVRRKADEVRLDVVLNIRVSKKDADDLDSLCDRIRISTRHGIARAALRLGMRALEGDPSLALMAGSDAPKPRRRSRTRS